jgi:outer membrane protein assembly factor BamB
MTTLLLVLALLQGTPASTLNETLFEAARAGDTARITDALDRGANVNAKARYDVTALIFAAMDGRLDAVKVLLARGADVNAADTFYRGRALDMALTNGHADVAVLLLQNGSAGADTALMTGVQSNNLALVQAAVARDVTRPVLQTAMTLAERQGRTTLVPIIKAVLDARPAEPAAPAFAIDPAALPRFAGTYRDAASGFTLTATVQDGSLVLQTAGQPPVRLVPTAPAAFRAADVPNVAITFNSQGDQVQSATLNQGAVTLTLTRGTTAAAAATPAAPSPTATVAAPSARAAARNWPSFRGDGASGNGDGQRAVAEWDVATGKNIKWKTPIPGIANSSPIVWGNRIYVTSAISSAGDKTFRTGLYGDVKPADDVSSHTWRIYCLDKTTGRIVWEREALAGAPKTKRHPKASQANSTPVTDGRRIVAAFGSVGALVAWDVDGKELWRADLGILDAGWFFDPTYQWGHSSSPIIYRDSVILQADMQKGSYLAAWDIGTGKLRWKTPRADEISTWGTPAIVRSSSGRDEIVTNGTKIRGYDPSTGKPLWTLGPNSEITIATPVTGDGLVFVTGGYPPVRPIYAIRAGATGDISLPAGKDASETVAWSNMTEGTYIPTPLLYGGLLYTLNINGVITAYDSKTGQRAFRGRVAEGAAFSASPIAADGRLYLATEDGDIHVVTAGPGLAPIAKNQMSEVIMATPAISDGLIVVRTNGHVFGIGQ